MTDTAPQAFPHPVDYLPGMTYRQWLVGMAMSGLLAHPGCVGIGPQHLATAAHELADAIIAESAKR